MFCEQTDCENMGLLLSPVIASFYTEESEETALDQAIDRPVCWSWYADDTFSSGPNKLKVICLDHLNIQFTMEKDRNGHLPFLGTDIYRDMMAPWVIKFTENPLTRIST
jgi:hypothetical protein